MRAPFFGLHCWKLTQDSGMPYNEKNKREAFFAGKEMVHRTTEKAL